MPGSLTRGGGENVPGIPGACATRKFTYRARCLFVESHWSKLVRHRQINDKTPLNEFIKPKWNMKQSKRIWCTYSVRVYYEVLIKWEKDETQLHNLVIIKLQACRKLSLSNQWYPNNYPCGMFWWWTQFPMESYSSTLYEIHPSYHVFTFCKPLNGASGSKFNYALGPFD